MPREKEKPRRRELRTVRNVGYFRQFSSVLTVFVSSDQRGNMGPGRVTLTKGEERAESEETDRTDD